MKYLQFYENLIKEKFNLLIIHYNNFTILQFFNILNIFSIFILDFIYVASYDQKNDFDEI
jgi:hypothetical protein